MPENKKMGRPIIGEPKDILVQLRLDKSSLNKLDKLSRESGISRSEMIRRLIKQAK